jgi:sigma-B regulation protein RsbU (phosphoserine phosphatase)
MSLFDEIRELLSGLAPGRLIDFGRHSVSNAQTAMLYEIGRAMASSMESVDKTHRLITETVTVILGVKRSVLLLIDPKKKELIVGAGSGLVDEEFLASFRVKLGRGILGDVAKTGQATWVKDVSREEKVLKKELKELGVESFLVAPLKIKEKVLGVITADSKIDGGNFTEDDLRLLTMLANLAAIAEENANLVARLQRKTEWQSAIFLLGKQIMDSGLSLQERLDTVVAKAIELTGANTGSLMLIDSETMELVIRSEKGLAPGVAEKLRLGIGEGVTGWVAKENKPLRVPRIKKDPRYVMANPKIESELAVPMAWEEKVIGVLNVDSFEEDSFSDQDMELLQMLASAASMAIHHAFLLDQLKKTQGSHAKNS